MTGTTRYCSTKKDGGSTEVQRPAGPDRAGGGYEGDGGFAAGRPIGPPPGLLNWIAAVETDNSGRIPAQELDVDVNFLSHFGFLSIPSQTLLLVPQDTDHSGTIGFNENVSRHLDRDRSGSIDGGELREVLSQFGYLSEAFQKLDNDRDGWIQINYDQFMHTMLTLS
ncbi:hypothetical protein K435DRAFT_821100 [Dendrothele bispora CBS 962.96]|uniref:EF-hand domain-containing protein n=1 Tax=Dendrothele bispora (strain CBS 962.96) TaxID=1314807 RepID=A0A4S8LN20_DENBC|nr:hypothetical protein K435DRAFT_821100 [Dendrothele bispora CBS 962.96]